MNRSHQALRTALKANGSFSAFSGLALLLFSSSFAKWMNIDQPAILMTIGGALLLFAGFVFYNALKNEINTGQVRFIIIQDWLWVIGSAILLAWRPFSISTLGNTLIAVVALIVLSFAITQAKTLRQNTPGK